MLSLWFLDDKHIMVALNFELLLSSRLAELPSKLFSLRASRRGHAEAVVHAFLWLVYMLFMWLSSSRSVCENIEANVDLGIKCGCGQGSRSSRGQEVAGVKK